MPTSFDPTDKKYQVSEDFMPDKASSWAFPIEKDGWMHAHNSLRSELSKCVEALTALQKRGGVLQEWEIQCLQTAWNSHCVHTHAHHENEDDLMVPFLKTRLHYPKQCETDHQALMNGLDDLKVTIDGLKVTGSAVDDQKAIDKILNKLKAYQALMLPHLKDEEETALPLMRAYFSSAEVAPIVQEIIGKGPKIEIGSFICAMGEDVFRKEFMPQEGIPFFVWYIDFRYRVALFQKEFLQPLEAIKTGVEPVVASSSWTSYCTIQ